MTDAPGGHGYADDAGDIGLLTRELEATFGRIAKRACPVVALT
jgi:hypothetical protein